MNETGGLRGEGLIIREREVGKGRGNSHKPNLRP